MSKGLDEGVRVGAVVNAIAILRHLAVAGAPQGVNAIARASGVSPSSSFNILRTLAREGLVSFDPASKLYAPGNGLADLVPSISTGRHAFERCAAVLQDFSDRHGSTTALWRVSASERLILLGFTEASSATRIHMTVGHRMPMLAGAGGRCVAAALKLTDDEIGLQYAHLRWESPPGLMRYQHEVRQAAARGWGLDDGDFLTGVTTMACVIGHDVAEFVVGASWFRGQRSPAQLAQIAEEMLRTRDLAATALGSGTAR